MSLEPDPPLPDPPAKARGEMTVGGRFAPGESIGAYVVAEYIGGGGMGEVYRATQSSLRRDVAIKVIRSEWATQRASRERFLAEQRSVGKLRHRHIVRAIDAGDSQAGPFLVMELVRGETVAATLSRHGPYDWPTACRLIRDVASGLRHIHDSGLLHRDLKPSNLIVDSEGIVKILDLGIAHRTWSESSADVSSINEAPPAWGSLDYLPPEAGQELAPLEPRSDLYSLGCTFFEMLVGRAPFADAAHSTPAAKLLAHWEQIPPPIGTLVDRVPRAVELLVAQLLEKRPDARPESASTVIEQLDQILATPVEQLEWARSEPRRFSRRALVATLAGVAVPMGVGAAWHWGQTPPPPALPEDPVVAGQIAADQVRASEGVELLGTFDTAACEVQGDWISTSRGLISPPDSQRGILQIPVLPRGEYDVKLRITPLEAPTQLMLAMVVGENLVPDYMTMTPNVKKGDVVFCADRTYEIVFKMRTTHIQIDVDGRQWEDWPVPQEPYLEREALPSRKSLFLGINFRCRVESIRLFDRDGAHERRNGAELLSQPARLDEFARYGPAIHDLAKVLRKRDGRLWHWENLTATADEEPFLMVAYQFGEPRWQTLDASELEPLERLQGPIGLQLYFVKTIPTSQFASIARVKRLMYLRLRWGGLTDAHLDLLAARHRDALRVLFCGDAVLTGAGAPALSALAQLHTLSLLNAQFDDAMMQAVGGLGTLQYLELSSSATDENLRPLLGHATLETLYIWNAKRVTAASLDVIASLPRLRVLSLYDCGIPESSRSRLESLGLPELHFSSSVSKSSANSTT